MVQTAMLIQTAIPMLKKKGMGMNFSGSSFGAISAVLVIVILLVVFGALAFEFLVEWKFYKKMGRRGWEGIIPIYKKYVMFDVLFGNGWNFLYLYVPFYGVYMKFKRSITLAQKFHKKMSFGIAHVFFEFICKLILVFSKSARFDESMEVHSNRIENWLRDLFTTVDTNGASSTERRKENEPVINEVHDDKSAIRCKYLLEDGQYERAKEYIEKALDENPVNAELYLFLAMAETGISEVTEVKNCLKTLERNSNFKRFLRIATEEQRAIIYKKGICPRCGKITTSEMGFCAACGEKLNWD